MEQERFPERYAQLTATSCKQTAHLWENMPKSINYMHAPQSALLDREEALHPGMISSNLMGSVICPVLEAGPLMEFKVCECLSKVSLGIKVIFTSLIHRVAMIQGCGL